MKELLKNPMFGILLSLAAFEAGLLLQKKTKLIFLNPLLTAIMMVIAVLMLSGIGLETYQLGGDIISLFLGPATVVLAVPLYQQVHSLKNDHGRDRLRNCCRTGIHAAVCLACTDGACHHCQSRAQIHYNADRHGAEC